MKKVLQSKKYNGDPNSGNCLSACIASIFELDITVAPDFNIPGCNWRNLINNYLKDRNLFLVSVPYGQYHSNVYGYHLIIGLVDSNPQTFHAVVGYNGHMYFDPVPNSPSKFIPISIEIFGTIL